MASAGAGVAAARTASRTSARTAPAAVARTAPETRPAQEAQDSRCFSRDQASASGSDPSA
ncbi:hypothetical protein ACE6JH_12270 [Streptomyces nigra]